HHRRAHRPPRRLGHDRGGARFRGARAPRLPRAGPRPLGPGTLPARSPSIRLFVNDRLDVALAAGAAGVQLAGGSLDPEHARGLNPNWWIGKSVHDLREAEAAHAAGADYLLLGPVFPTATHPSPGRAPLGPGSVAAVVGLGLPVIAIGGVTPARLPELRAAGVYGVAAIRALWDAADPRATARRMVQELNQ